ncbi:hypothetical protein [Phaeospirillum tilakii]|uniref:Uncharacterized protein n=1 Tax=Phaeospirillum tilakii TaxID=741673 RepID=A0ABW5CCL3_9PROT
MPPPPPTKYGPVGQIQKVTAPRGPAVHLPPPTRFGPVPRPPASHAPPGPAPRPLQRMVKKATTAEEYQNSLGPIPSQVGKRLIIANQSIIYTRGKLSYGAANIPAQVQASNGMSYLAATEATTYARIIRSKIGNSFIDQQALQHPGLKPPEAQPVAKITEINDAAARAIAARKFRAGVCDDFASVAFFHLKETVTPDTEIYRLSLQVSADSFHAAVILADPGLDAQALRISDSAVVVDAWPTRAFAVRVVDWKYKNAVFTISFKGSDLSSKNYLHDVRQVWKGAYFIDGEPCYRRFGDDLAEDGNTYETYFRNKAKLFRDTPHKYNGETWGQTWDDDTSL